MPGVTVRWANDAREGLREVTDAYLRRRAKARIEKYARTRKIPVITKEIAFPLIEETVGRDKLGDGWDTLIANTRFAEATPQGRDRPERRLHLDRGRGRAAEPRAGGLHAGHDPRGDREGGAREAGGLHRPRPVRGGDRPRAGHDERGHRRLHQEQAPELRRRAEAWRRADPGAGTGIRRSVVAMTYKAYAVSWNLTQRCNLFCAHCYISAAPGASAAGELSTDECRRVMADIARVNPGTFLILTGGEPLLRPDIFELAAEGREHGFTVVLGTNGVLLRPKQARLMKTHGVQGRRSPSTRSTPRATTRSAICPAPGAAPSGRPRRSGPRTSTSRST